MLRTEAGLYPVLCFTSFMFPLASAWFWGVFCSDLENRHIVFNPTSGYPTFSDTGESALSHFNRVCQGGGLCVLCSYPSRLPPTLTQPHHHSVCPQL